jgi:hypothetical protein
MNHDWDRVRDRLNQQPEHAATLAEEAARRANHPAYSDPVLLAIGGLMLGAVVIGILTRIIF